MTKIIENIQNPHRPRIPIGEPHPNRSNHQIPGISLVTESHKVRLLSFFNVPILHQYHFRKNTYVFWETDNEVLNAFGKMYNNYVENKHCIPF